MLNHNVEHDYFEQLCALAPLGQISADELAELRAHLSICIACRKDYEAYADIVHDKLPSAESARGLAKLRGFFSPRADGYKERFMAEAKQRGFQFSEEATLARATSPRRWPPLPATVRRYAGAVAVALLFIALPVAGYEVLTSPPRGAAEAREVADLKSQNEDLRRQLAEFAAHKTHGDGNNHATLQPLVVDVPAPSQTLPDLKDARYQSWLESELYQARNENAGLQAHARAIEEQLQATTLQVQALRAEIESSKTAGTALMAKLESTERNLSQVSSEMQNLRDGRSQDAATISKQESRMKEMADNLRAQAADMDRERELLKADRDIRDLMTARNLHIVDVYDMDDKGNTRKTFGRVFYTEDKNLIFYAYDVSDKRLARANYSLQAWGSKEIAEKSAMSLGIFYADTQKKNRWVLKFSDPKVLEAIDTVFVTIEPLGGSKSPTGQKLLYAYLRTKPNHP